MGKITGKVLSVKKGSGIVDTPMGSFERLNMTIQSEDGEKLVIQKLVKPGNDGTKLIGQNVQATYTEMELTNNKGEKFTSRAVKGKDFVLLDAPKFGGNANTAAKTVNTGSTKSITSYNPVKTSTYSSEGARHGMIVGNAIELAIARLTLDQAGLFKAAHDVTELTKFVETGALLENVPSATTTKALKDDDNRKTFKKKETKAVEINEDEEDPFADMT